MVSRSARWLLLLAGVAALPALAGKARLEAMIPEDTDAVVLVQDLPALLDAWPKSPLAQTWNDPQVKRFFAPLRESMRIDEWERLAEQEVGFPLSEILAAFDGQLMVALPDFAAIIEEERGGAPAALGLVAHVGNDEVVGALARLETEDEEAEAEGVRWEKTEEEFQGVTLHLERELDAQGAELSTSAWALFDGLFVAGQPDGYVKELVAAARRGSVASSFAESRVWSRLSRRGAKFDLIAFLNTRRLVPLLIEEAKRQQEESEQPDPLGLDVETMLKALSLEAIEGAFLTAGIDRRQTRTDLGLLYGPEEGIVKLLAYEPPPVKLPDIIPGDVLQASVNNFSVSRFWAELIAMLERMNPMVGPMLEMQREQSKAAVGFDPLDALVTSLGGQIVSADFLPRAERPGEEPSLEAAESLWGIAVEDRQSLEMAVEAIKTLAGGGGELFEARDYLGHTIHTFKMPMPREEDQQGPDRFVSYAVTDDYLLIGAGSSMPIESVLARMRQSGKSLWRRPDVKAALATLPEGASALSYSDVAALIKGLFDLMARGQALAEGDHEGEDGDEGDDEPFCDPRARPDPRTLERYFDIAVGGVYKDSGLLYVTSRLLHPKR